MSALLGLTFPKNCPSEFRHLGITTTHILIYKDGGIVDRTFHNFVEIFKLRTFGAFPTGVQGRTVGANNIKWIVSLASVDSVLRPFQEYFLLGDFDTRWARTFY